MLFLFNMVSVSKGVLRSLFEPPPLSLLVCRLTQGEVNSVLEQLEQDRIVASKRARRLQEDLYKTQQVPPQLHKCLHCCSLIMFTDS